MEKERYDWLDALRGAAIILVIIGHVIGGLHYGQNAESGGYGMILRKIIYSFHMPLMFVISGYVAKEYSPYDREKNRGRYFLKFMKKSILALYLPYLIWGYAFWAVKYFVYAGNESVTLSDGLRLFWNCSGVWTPGWYLLTLLAVKAIDMIMQLVGIKKEYEGAFWILLYAAGCFFNIYLLSDICGFGIFFFLGRILRGRKYNEGRTTYALCLAGAAIGMVLYLGSFEYFGKLMTGSLISVFLMCLFSSLNISGRVLTVLGRNSMVPYVLHAYFTIPVRIVLDKAGCSYEYIYAIAESAVAVVLSLAVITLMERVGFFHKFEVLFYPTRKRTCHRVVR